MSETDAPPTNATPADRSSLRSVIGSIAHAMEHTMSSGDLAELRRISPDQPYTPALWKVLVSIEDDTFTHGDAREQQWAALLMAMASGAKHDPSKRFGHVLAEHGWSELRFVRLMRARDTRLVEELRRLAQYLASKGASVDWTGAANLLFNQTGQWAEEYRRRIARDYYRSLYANETRD